MMCHANVKSNIVTDFGYGNSWFLGGDHIGNDLEEPSRPYKLEGVRFPFFASYESAWQGRPGKSGEGAVVEGQLFVPNVVLTSGEPSAAAMPREARATKFLASVLSPTDKVTPFAGPIHLSEMLKREYYTKAHNADTEGVKAPMVKGFSGVDGEKVVSKDRIYIGAPTREQIEALVAGSGVIPAYPVSGEGARPFGSEAVSKIQEGSFKIQNEFKCFGDVVVKGSVLLHDVSITTDKGGCRLYVRDSVFVRNTIPISPAEGSLQITSGRAIVLGMSVATLRDRVLTTRHRDNAFMRTAQDSASVKTAAEAVVADATAFSGSLEDAWRDDTKSYRVREYSRLLLNVGSSRVDLQACKLEYSIVSPK